MQILANPSPPSLQYLHPWLTPLSIASIEGLMLGIVLLLWTKNWWPAFFVGFAINTISLSLFWTAMSHDWFFWDYDYALLAFGELFVVLAEAGGITWFLAKRLRRDPCEFWWKAMVVSVTLNALSFFAGTLSTTSDLPSNVSDQIIRDTFDE